MLDSIPPLYLAAIAILIGFVGLTIARARRPTPPTEPNKAAQLGRVTGTLLLFLYIAYIYVLGTGQI